MERQALVNLAQVASALGPSIKRKTQGDNTETPVGPGNKIPAITTIKEEVEVTKGGKHSKEARPHTIPRTTSTSPPPPYPSISAEEDMELCSTLYSTIKDVEIVTIP